MQVKLGEQNFHEGWEKAIEPVTKFFKDVSEVITKIMTVISNKNNQASEELNNKFLGIMNVRGKKSPSLLSPLSKVTNPENETQFKLVKDSSLNRVDGLFIHNTLPITLHDNLLTLRDTSKVFELKRDLLKMITYRNYNDELC